MGRESVPGIGDEHHELWMPVMQLDGYRDVIVLFYYEQVQSRRSAGYWNAGRNRKIEIVPGEGAVKERLYER